MGQSKLEFFSLKVGEIYGSLFFFLFALFFIFLYDILWGIFLSSSLIMSYIVTAFIRVCYFKQRPQPRGYSTIVSKIQASSFPSAHVQRPIFFLFFLTSLSYLFVFVGFLGVIVVMLQRYIQKYHDVYDILGGVILGVILGFFIKTLVF